VGVVQNIGCIHLDILDFQRKGPLQVHMTTGFYVQPFGFGFCAMTGVLFGCKRKQVLTIVWGVAAGSRQHQDSAVLQGHESYWKVCYPFSALKV
jgi:hypothetical protein